MKKLLILITFSFLACKDTPQNEDTVEQIAKEINPSSSSGGDFATRLTLQSTDDVELGEIRESDNPNNQIDPGQYFQQKESKVTAYNSKRGIIYMHPDTNVIKIKITKKEIINSGCFQVKGSKNDSTNLNYALIKNNDNYLTIYENYKNIDSSFFKYIAQCTPVYDKNGILRAYNTQLFSKFPYYIVGYKGVETKKITITGPSSLDLDIQMFQRSNIEINLNHQKSLDTLNGIPLIDLDPNNATNIEMNFYTKANDYTLFVVPGALWSASLELQSDKLCNNNPIVIKAIADLIDQQLDQYGAINNGRGIYLRNPIKADSILVKGYNNGCFSGISGNPSSGTYTFPFDPSIEGVALPKEVFKNKTQNKSIAFSFPPRKNSPATQKLVQSHEVMHLLNTSQFNHIEDLNSFNKQNPYQLSTMNLPKSILRSIDTVIAARLTYFEWQMIDNNGYITHSNLR